MKSIPLKAVSEFFYPALTSNTNILVGKTIGRHVLSSYMWFDLMPTSIATADISQREDSAAAAVAVVISELALPKGESADFTPAAAVACVAILFECILTDASSKEHDACCRPVVL